MCTSYPIDPSRYGNYLSTLWGRGQFYLHYIITNLDVSFFDWQLFLLRAAGFLLPCYIMIWAISILQHRRQAQVKKVDTICKYIITFTYDKYSHTLLTFGEI